MWKPIASCAEAGRGVLKSVFIGEARFQRDENSKAGQTSGEKGTDPPEDEMLDRAEGTLRGGAIGGYFGRNAKSILIGFAVLIAGATIIAPTLLDRWTRVQPFAGTLPNPNGYNDLIRAGASVVGRPPRQGRVWDADESELRSYVDRNPQALRFVRLGLSRDSRVPLQYSDGFIPTHLGDLTALRDGARVLAADGFLKIREERLDLAVSSFLDLLRLGRASARGGALIDEQVGLSQERLGLLGLARIRSKLSARACRDLIKRLERLDADREPLDAVFRRDRLLGLASSGWQARSIAIIRPKSFDALLQPAHEMTRRSRNTLVTHERLLIIDLALRAYRLEHPKRRPPKRLEELVPEYLDRLPNDPFRSDGGGFRFKEISRDGLSPYGVGPDGDDDGGRALPESSPNPKNRDDGDLRVDPA